MNVFSWFTGHFSKRGKALTIYKRGMSKANLKDHQGAIDDYTTTIDLPDIPADIIAMALYNRAVVYTASGEDPKATEDLKVLLAMPAAPASIKNEARRRLIRMERRASHTHDDGEH